jgi:tetratricopeptide (TPR) repeat protein
VSDASKAVFLSYASQDADVARRICEALRATGVEVWFDQSELRGGDAWDAAIRKQIKECAMFVPIISANTQSRAEGYFRLEWRLAVDRSHLMADDAPFLFPIVIGDVSEAAARVPDKFREVQWTRLKLEETATEIAARVAKLLAGGQETGDRGQWTGRKERDRGRKAEPREESGFEKWWWLIFPIMGMAVPIIGVLKRPAKSERHPPAAAIAPAQTDAAAPQTAGTLTRDWPKDPELKRVMEIINGFEAIAEDYALAEDMARAVVEKKPFDPEAATVLARVHSQFLLRGFDRSDERYAQGRRQAERALALAPDEPEALYSLAVCIFSRRVEFDRVEQLLRRASELAPAESNYPRYLAFVVSDRDAAAGLKLAEENAARFPGDVLAHYDLARQYRDVGRSGDMEAALDRAIAIYPLTNALGWKARMRLWVHEDLAGMRETLNLVPDRHRSTERVVFGRFIYSMVSGDVGDGLEGLDGLTEAWIEDYDFTGPRDMLKGELRLLQGRPELARLDFEAALNEVARQKVRSPTEVAPHLAEVWILHRLGRTAEAREGLGLVLDSLNRPFQLSLYSPWLFQPLSLLLVIGEREKALELFREAAVRPEARQMIRTALKFDPHMAPWRDDAEILTLVAEPEKAN